MEIGKGKTFWVQIKKTDIHHVLCQVPEYLRSHAVTCMSHSNMDLIIIQEDVAEIRVSSLYLNVEGLCQE